MNVLLIIGLVLFACTIVWIYILFVTNAINDNKKTVVQEPIYDDAYERCQKLFEQGMHAELQRYAQRALQKNYSDIEIRRLLAQSLMAAGNEQMAIMHYEAITNISPGDIKTLELLAQYYYEHGPKPRTAELYEQILYYDRGNFNAVEQLVKLYEEFENFDRALELYQMLIDAEVDENVILELEYKMANIYLQIQDFSRAYEAYERIYKKNPDNLEILIMLADLANKNHYWQDCLKYYQKVVSIVGDDFEILEKIAQLHTTLENWQEAVDLYKKIISMEDKQNTNYLYHQNELCSAMLKNQQYEEAIDTLQELVVQNPQETSFNFTLAQAYTIVGQYQQGINLYNKLLEDLPPEQGEMIVKHISNLICAWACDLFKKGEYNQAFDKFFEALKYDEENDEVYYELGRCNYYIKSFQDSIAHFKRAISIKPQMSRYYYGLGCAYDEMGSTKGAKSSFQDAVNIDPMNLSARRAYAISLTKELEYAQSIEQFIEIVKQAPDDADTIYNLALAYELVGDIERAIKNYKKALSVAPNHKEAKHNLELLLGEEYVIETQEEEQEIVETTQQEPVFEEENNIPDFNVFNNGNSMFS